MSTTGTVVEVTGEVWARGADGSLRRLSTGDELTGTETLILAAGAALVVRSGSGADAEVVTLEGPESGFLIVPPDQTEPFLASPDLARMIEEDLLSGSEREQEPEPDPAPRLGDGHRFVQLVRIEDELETDSIAPLNLARNREVLRPMTIDWAGPVEEELVQRYSGGRDEEQSVNRAPPAIQHGPHTWLSGGYESRADRVTHQAICA